MAKDAAVKALKKKRLKRLRPDGTIARGELPKEQSLGFKNFEFPFKGRTVKSTDPAFPFLKGVILDKFKGIR